MHSILSLLLAAAVAIPVSACANKPEEEPPSAKMSYAPEDEPRQPARANLRRFLSTPAGKLAGRTIRVSDVSDLVLRPGEVVLTFDDGPIPGKTDAMLETLDQYGVKATFLMVGQMARNYPELARKVAARGHTIGNHTQSHKNLGLLGFDQAVSEIEKGRRSINAALRPGGSEAAPFFRFPYLVDTLALRRHIAAQGGVVIDPSIDSKDYLIFTPDQVRSRTLSLLERSGSGIILFHDLHARTVAMLPGFLSDLQERGYKVVHLVPSSPKARQMLISALTRRSQS